MTARILSVGLLALFLSACGARHYQLQLDGPGDLLIPPKRGGEPLSSRDAYQQAYGPFARNGYINLRDGMHIQVVAPVMPADEAIATKVVSQVQESPTSITVTLETNVTGWEEAYYVVERDPADGALALRFLEGTRQSQEHSQPINAPERAHITAPGRFPMLRHVFQQGESAADRDAGLIAASTEQGLTHALARLEQNCEGPPAEDVGCLRLTGGVAINAMIGVTVNGRMRYFPPGTALRGLLRSSDGVAPGTVPAALKLRRPFRHRLAKVKYEPAAVPGLVLTDGDRVEWKSAAIRLTSSGSNR